MCRLGQPPNRRSSRDHRYRRQVYETVGSLDFEQSEPADDVGWPLTMVGGAAMAVLFCWQAVLYNWRWGDPGIDRFDDLIGDGWYLMF